MFFKSQNIFPSKCLDLSCLSRPNLTLESCVNVCVAVGAATLISPLELIRTKLQSERLSYRQLSAVIRAAVHTEGWLALWRGLGPTLLRDVPFSGKINKTICSHCTLHYSLLCMLQDSMLPLSFFFRSLVLVQL